MGSPADPEKQQKFAENLKQMSDISKFCESPHKSVSENKNGSVQNESIVHKSPCQSRKESLSSRSDRSEQHRHSDASYKVSIDYTHDDIPRTALLMKNEPDLLPTSPQHYQVCIISI